MNNSLCDDLIISRKIPCTIQYDQRVFGVFNQRQGERAQHSLPILMVLRNSCSPGYTYYLKCHFDPCKTSVSDSCLTLLMYKNDQRSHRFVEKHHTTYA